MYLENGKVMLHILNKKTVMAKRNQHKIYKQDNFIKPANKNKIKKVFKVCDVDRSKFAE